MVVVTIIADSNDHSFASENLSVNRNISDFCLVRSIIHGIILGEEEKYLSPIEKTVQVFNLFLQPHSVNTVLRALRKPLRKY